MIGVSLMLLALAHPVRASSDSSASEPEIGPRAETALPDPLAAGWKGEPVCEVLAEDPRRRALRCSFPPGVGHERHFHAPHFGYTLRGGTMRIRDGEGVREVEIETGSSWASEGVAWHEVVNVGETTAVFLIVEDR